MSHAVPFIFQTSSLQTATVSSELGGTIHLAAPLQFSGIKRYFRLIKCSFTKYLANIHNVTGVENNGLFAISNDGGVNWTNIQLQDGLYRAYDIELVANKIAADLGWWTTITDPGFKIRGNPATQHTYTILDSTKLAAPGQLAIDFSLSLIWQFLGYTNPAAQTFVVDGEFDSVSPELVNWFGDELGLYIGQLGAISLRNGNQSSLVSSISLAVAYGSNNIIYPLAGIQTALLPLPQAPQLISDITVTLRGSRLDASGAPVPVYFPPGSELTVEFELVW